MNRHHLYPAQFPAQDRTFGSQSRDYNHDYLPESQSKLDESMSPTFINYFDDTMIMRSPASVQADLLDDSLQALFDPLSPYHINGLPNEVAQHLGPETISEYIPVHHLADNVYADSSKVPISAAIQWFNSYYPPVEQAVPAASQLSDATLMAYQQCGLDGSAQASDTFTSKYASNSGLATPRPSNVSQAALPPAWHGKDIPASDTIVITSMQAANVVSVPQSPSFVTEMAPQASTPGGSAQQADLAQIAEPSTTFYNFLVQLDGRRLPWTPPTLPLTSDVIEWSERIRQDCNQRLAAYHPHNVKMATRKKARVKEA